MGKGIKIVAGVLIVLVIMQFVSSTDNNGSAYGANDITHVIPVPDTVKHILENSCFDCHSNHTNYIWYSSVQPIGFWIGHHINEGKEEINFSEYRVYSAKRKAKKMQNIVKQLKNDKMPINSYLRLHPEATLTPEQKQMVINWADSAYAVLSAQIH